MSEATKIEWATSTGNPWVGCTKVSPGCKNCYAAALDNQRFSRTMGGGTKANPISHWGKGAPRFRTKGFWKDALKWNRDHARLERDKPQWPLRPRPRIFPSLCDWLDDEVPIEWLADFLKLIHDTPNLDWLLLTKRPENWMARIGKILPSEIPMTGFLPWLWNWRCGRSDLIPKNVWIGVSVEDQQRADERIPELLKIPAKVRFLSVEPLLGHVDMRLTYSVGITQNASTVRGNEIDWVIVGGESGHSARPCNIEWIRSIVSQCKSAGVPVFCKQGGSNLWDRKERIITKHPKGGDLSEIPQDLRIRKFPVKALERKE